MFNTRPDFQNFCFNPTDINDTDGTHYITDDTYQEHDYWREIQNPQSNYFLVDSFKTLMKPHFDKDKETFVCVEDNYRKKHGWKFEDAWLRER